MLASAAGQNAGPPLTVAEKSGYQATARHQEVLDYCGQLAKLSPVVRLGEMGTSVEGRKLPLMIVSDPPVATPEEAASAASGGKLVVLLLGNIHAGEVDGKEALLMLARDLALAKERPLLKDLVLVFAPIFNADGNERMAKTNRAGQVGPAEGAGVRPNAQDLDLNRDFVKLETPEVRALVRFFNRWDPAVFIDCHTTNGSRHRYALTYEGGGCPAGDAKVVAYTRDELLPDAGRRMEQASGYRSQFYGNFSQDRNRWETIPPTPRYGSHYFGLRNRIAVLSESYSYASYKDRVLASRAFVRGVLEHAAEKRDRIRGLLADARLETSRRDRKEDQVVLRHRAAPLGDPRPILGFEEEVRNGRRVATDRPKDYLIPYWGGVEATLSVRRPFAYLFPASLTNVVENLQRHGVQVDELREDLELDVEAERVDGVTRAAAFQKHQPVSLRTTPRTEARRVPAGTIVVRTAQPRGSLAAYLLEARSSDGLATWNFLDQSLAEGRDYPVLRLLERTPLVTTRVRPLAEERRMNRALTFDTVYTGGRPLDFSGSPVSGLTWLDDGEHYLQVLEGRLHRVHAATGRSRPFLDPERLSKDLAALPGIPSGLAQSMASTTTPRFNPDRTGALFESQNDLYFYRLDGTAAVRLTNRTGTEELASFSPDGRFVAFVRGGNLYAVDIATQTERALTTDATELVSNGKGDWVYTEEIFNRNPRAYWWSPDSTHLAFLRFDDAPVPRFPVVNSLPGKPVVEATPYPRAGEPNPLVRLGIVAAAGGPARWADLGDYPPASTLIVRAGWMPDSRSAFAYVQDRAQTWLDFVGAPIAGGKPTRLFRETTKAWVDDPGPPAFLKDGSFLLFSERTGWKHLYRFAKDGTLIGPVTSGDWEARTLHLVDQDSGCAYFSGTRDISLADHLYRVRLDGTGLERLTRAEGDHRVTVAPRGRLFIDSWSDHRTPTRVQVCAGDGSPVRTLDTNPVYALEEYRRGRYELVRIPAGDGFTLDGSLLKPPGFDPKRRYPVWFTTYGGPHAPVVDDSWGGGHITDQVKAQMGFLVFRCDPRSASGRGACSTWTAYRRLGEQELKDIEAAIRWLCKNPWVDPARIGMSGHSYGGFMTAFALTHSKLFAAGIAGAPVTDWRNYDSIYTERYMNTPQENPEGYDATSVVKSAAKLQGRLLLVHGLRDDNVHAQNTVQLVDALQQANKDFEVMLYPPSRHGIAGRHYTRLQYDFMRRVLKPGY